MHITKRKNQSEKNEMLENGNSDDAELRTDITGDKLNIAILLFLYTLQGIPLGLAGAIPMLLQNRGISYTQQAEFSFVYWPFSVKLLWAPIVDSLFLPKFGRRKTWLVPVQYLIGLCMLILSFTVPEWLGSGSVEPSMVWLTISFCFLNFLAATQDIAVDGWALNMLKRRNVSHASTCNSVGQTAGFFLGYVVFVALESASFCNTYLRSVPQDEGIITLSSFLMFWGWVFIASTTLLALFKTELPDASSSLVQRDRGVEDVIKAYKKLRDITRLPSVRKLALVLLTAKIGFSACDAVSGLKLVEAGVPKEDLALLAVPLVPVQILMPLLLSKHSTGPEPLSLWLKAFPLRLICGPIVAVMVLLTPYLIADGGPSVSYLGMLVILYMFQQACLYSMFVAAMAFFARVSDPAVGGTYMTLLNTLSNLGTNWPNTLSLWAIDHLTFKGCSAEALADNTCSSAAEKLECADAGGSCVTYIDGFYIEAIICLILGFLWLQVGRPVVNKLQKLPLNRWQLSHRKEKSNYS